MTSSILILGAGISGLATAWFLKQTFGSSVNITILEASDRAGGWIQTIRKEGFLFELGPRSCRTKGNGDETLALVEALGLETQVIKPHPDAKKRYVVHQGRLQKLPAHLWEIPFSSLTQGWFKALLKDWSEPRRRVDDESIASFFGRRLGQSYVEHLVDPFVTGIYAGDCQRLSLKSCFPLLDSWEQQYESLLRGGWHHEPKRAFDSPFIQSMRRAPMLSFQNGMECLTLTLTERLKDCLFLKSRVQQLHFSSSSVEVVLDTQQRLKADGVISTLPTHDLSPLLTDLCLTPLPYASVTLVNLGFKHESFPLKGFGYLVPSKEHSPLLGSVWDSCVFPQQNQGQQTRLTLMLGGKHGSFLEKMPEEDILKIGLEALYQHCHFKKEPDVYHVHHAKHAIPQYEVGYAMWKQDLDNQLKRLEIPLILSGSAFTGVSLNDCIAHARKLSDLSFLFFCKK